MQSANIPAIIQTGLANNLLRGSIAGLVVVSFLAACTFIATPSATPEILARELVYCDYAELMPQSVLDGFTSETGIQIRYQPFISMEEVVENIKTQNTCDVVNLDNRFVLELSQAGYLAKLNKANIPNIKNISANFRDMAYDPQNYYTIPSNWGTTGLLFRSDLVQATSWNDLWNSDNPGKIGLWSGEPRDGIGLALKSLGFSANSENPAEVNAAIERLIELSPRVIFLDDFGQDYAIDFLNESKVVMAMGWAADATLAIETNPHIQYILPEEGALLWGENYVIPIGKTNQPSAELLLDYFLRPEVSAEIVNSIYYATPNLAAHPYIQPEILQDPVIFPSNESLKNAEVILPLSPEILKIYYEGWERFVDSQKAK